VKLIKYLANLGYGTRREVVELIAAGRVTDRDSGRLTLDATDWSHERLRVHGQPLDPAKGVVIMLHKPVGYVCSTSDAPPLVYELLPPRFQQRTPIIATVGRLDRDTSGLLLLTDDGGVNHRLTSPRKVVPKTYRVTLAADLRGDEAAVFVSGTLRLSGETDALRPATLVTTGARSAEITIAEGRYHQVRRMFAAVGNHVTALHRAALGPLHLGTLAPAQWRILADNELALLHALATTPTSSPSAP
jgi:16S rRNA pseudouridine516 synthase